MKHDQILTQQLVKAKNNSKTLGFLVFGSVATGTHHKKSDIDLIIILRNHTPSSGIENIVIDDIKVGKTFFTYEVLTHSVNTVPYLLHILVNAKLLFDRENTIKPLLEKITNYFMKNPEIEDEWSRYYKQLREEKMQFGYEKTTIIDIWNELEKRYSGGEIKRTFLRQYG
ncbi:MAG: hypothetical protein GTN76_16980 [Candidatus Aenigmarchaeota archaeon]|nr:hypothetical protein [Candidatus Aenigmarchaeota archaeon]